MADELKKCCRKEQEKCAKYCLKYMDMIHSLKDVDEVMWKIRMRYKVKL